MRIAIVETVPRGGLLHYAVQLGDALAARGHAVELLTTRGNELVDHVGGACMRPLLTSSEVGAWRGGSTLARYRRRARIAARLAAAWARVLYEVRRGRYDVVLVTNDLSVALTAAGCLGLAALPGRQRLAHVCHNARPFNRWAGDDLYASSPVLLAVLRRVYARVDLVLLHGERSREEFVRHWRARRIAVIPHGDERIFGREPPPPSDDERILFFGDWRKVKGLSVLMEAFDRLIAARPTARLTIAGAPSTEGDPDAVRAWAARHGDAVEVDARYIPTEEVRDRFATARVVALPYLAGYQSGVAHVAMTMARAVVASDVGDVSRVVIDGTTGRIVPPGDAEALAAALDEILGDPALAERLGAAGHRRLREAASWEEVAERVEAELDALTR